MPTDPTTPGRERNRADDDSGILDDAPFQRQEQDQPPRRKRGRPSKTDLAQRGGEVATVPQDNRPKKKRGRPSNAEKAVQASQSQSTPGNASMNERAVERIGQSRARPSQYPQPRKRGRPSLTREDVVSNSSPPRQPKPKKRGRPSLAQNDRVGNRDSPRRKRRSKDEDHDLPEYQHLAAVERKVPRQTIDSKWNPLPSNAIERVSNLMGDVEKSVVMRLRDERKRVQAATAIAMVARRLQRKLIRGLPFPPSTRPQREEDFDFEKISDSNKVLETQLTPSLHSVELLKAEIIREASLLDEDTRNLDLLEANARADASKRKREVKNSHFLLNVEADTETDSLGVPPALADRKSNLQDTITIGDDRPLKPVISQLHDHLETMRSNLVQIEGLRPALDASKAAVEDVLYRYLGTKRYGDVVLG